MLGLSGWFYYLQSRRKIDFANADVIYGDDKVYSESENTITISIYIPKAISKSFTIVEVTNVVWPISTPGICSLLCYYSFT